jgi:hypothetical protein
MRRLYLALLFVCLIPSASLRSNHDAFREASIAWDRGEYVSALNAYLNLLASPDADAMLEAIALQTGELYKTIELTADGTSPLFSPNGRHITYETGSGANRTVRLIDADNPATTKVELRGFSASFSPDGSQLVYLRTMATKDLKEEYAALDKPRPSERAQRLETINEAAIAGSRVVVRDLASGSEVEIDTGNLRKSAPMLAANGTVLFAGSPASASSDAESPPTQIYWATPGSKPSPLTRDSGNKTILELNATGTAALVAVRTNSGARSAGSSQGFGFLSLPDGRWTPIQGSAPAFSADGHSFVYLTQSEGESQLHVARTDHPAESVIVRKGVQRIDAPALSPDGSHIAFQLMARDDWELYVIDRDGSGERRLTREIQHDLLPRFLTADRLLGVMGERRHRRSYIYDLATGERTRLFHNNTVRTIAPEYIWVPSRDGTRILISAERDGDTVSPERGVYLVDLSRRITRDELRARLRENVASEEAMISKGLRLYAPIADSVRRVVNEASVARVFDYEKRLYDFDSKHISQPGNKLAGEYLFETYKSFGYEPTYQWFDSRSAVGGRTANVIATLRGTINPELVYVVSSHYDSVAIGPGADDDSSGTAALLEAARILAKHPQPATIVFASFTGEESGLLGSREFVRRAIADNVRVVGALNNDMIGWANDGRLDNTIRYSNPGIRDVQHAAAMQFTRLITYDALYYKGTDAAAYYDAYGDIVGGIGSYPVLGNPHYHQPHDILETINHQLVTEVAKTTAATLMLLASSPSRLTDLKVVEYTDGVAFVSWRPGAEAGITEYIVAYGPPDDPEAQRTTVRNPTARLKVPAGSVVSVKAVNAKGLEGWDWARVIVR